MASVDEYLSKLIKMTRHTLGDGYRRLFEKYGPPSEQSAFSSLHFLLTEYQEPPPFQELNPYKVEPGLPVARRTHHLAPAGGGPTVKLELAFPDTGDRELPAVVISPGLGAHPNANRYLEDHLASHGYLVVRPRHRGSDWLGVALRTPFGAFTRTELQRRVGEIESTLQALLAGTLGFSPRGDDICLAGHSFGALTNGILAGLRARSIQVNGEYPIKALVVLSPYGNSFPTQRLGIDPKSFGEVTVPTLFVSGTKDDLWTLGKGPSSHLEPYLTCRSSVKSHLMIGGTRHGNFSEICGWVRANTRIMLNSTVTAFLDAHMLGDEAAEAYLAEQLRLVAFQHGSWVL